MKIITYARVSTREQAEKGYSIAAQSEKLRAYASQKGHNIVKEFVDIESAKQEGRANFNKMVEFVKENPEVEGILCHKVDRLCRNFKDYVTIDELDVKPLFVIQDFPDNAAGKLSFGMQVLLAKHYIDNLSEEAKKGMRQKAEQGTYPSFAPVGYENVNRNGKKVIELNPEKAELVKKMFERYASGNYSLSEVRNLAVKEGFRGRHGAKPSTNGVYYILSNVFYTGLFTWDGKVYQGDHTPIISMETYRKAQEAMKKDNKPNERRERKFAYTGLLTCAHCGCAITAEIKKGKYIYYHCTGSKGDCPTPYIREEDLEKKLAQIVQRIKIDSDTLEWLKGVLKKNQRKKTEYHEAQIETFQKKLKTIRDRLDQAYEDKVDGVITEEFWEQQSSKWMRERKELLEAIERYEEANQVYLEKGLKILELCQRLYKVWKREDQAVRKEILTTVLSNCEWDGEKLIPTYQKPYSWMAEERSRSEWYAWEDSNPRPTD